MPRKRGAAMDESRGKKMGKLDNLEPKKVFHYFEEICAVPRPSYHEKEISDYLVRFAQEHGLEHYQDELYNVVMIAPATPGYEDEEPLILQGHMDMVCEKEPGYVIDFEKDALDLSIEGDYVKARHTTLGGDDGIALAMALAILDSPDVAHPLLEAVFTVSEEVGMEGASHIDLSMLKGHKLLNLDSEAEGIITVSCAGGNSTVCRVPVEYRPAGGMQMNMHILGLRGGHSGIEIDRGRANANRIMARLLLALRKGGYDFGIAELEGGAKQNAIPRESHAVLVIAPEDMNRLCACLEKEFERIKKEYGEANPDMELEAEASGNITGRPVLDADSAGRAISLLDALPDGVQSMSADIEGLVQTSLNMGIMELDAEKKELRLEFAIRSSVGKEREGLTDYVGDLVEREGGFIDVNGTYPAWEYKKDSVLREDAVRIYQKMYGALPRVEAVHAGLECGILAGKIEGFDGISIGPDIAGIHTVDEKLSISSVGRVYDYVLELLKCRHIFNAGSTFKND